MTLKELVLQWDAYQIDRWWHTALLAQQLYNIQTILVNALSKKSKMKPKNITEFHPYVEKSKPAMTRITKKNFGLLKVIGNALCAKK